MPRRLVSWLYGQLDGRRGRAAPEERQPESMRTVSFTSAQPAAIIATFSGAWRGKGLGAGG
jgi:hypothetical protein